MLQGHRYKNPLPKDDNTSQTELKVNSPERMPTPPHSAPSPKKQQHRVDFPLIDLKYPEQSLPHYYESLRGNHIWLGTPSTGGSLEVLEEERGAAAANCNDVALNSVGRSHQYAVLEPEEDVRCQLAGLETADSLPSLLAPSSLDYDGGDSAASSTAAVLSVETNPLALPAKPDPFSSAEPRSKKKSLEDLAAPDPNVSVYDNLKPKKAVSESTPQETLGEGASNAIPPEDRVTLSLKPATKKSKDCQYNRLDSAP